MLSIYTVHKQEIEIPSEIVAVKWHLLLIRNQCLSIKSEFLKLLYYYFSFLLDLAKMEDSLYLIAGKPIGTVIVLTVCAYL